MFYSAVPTSIATIRMFHQTIVDAVCVCAAAAGGCKNENTIKPHPCRCCTILWPYTHFNIKHDETHYGPFRAFNVNFRFARWLLSSLIATHIAPDSIKTDRKVIKKENEKKTKNTYKLFGMRLFALACVRDTLCGVLVFGFGVREMVCCFIFFCLCVCALCICPQKWIRHGVLHYVPIN